MAARPVGDPPVYTVDVCDSWWNLIGPVGGIKSLEVVEKFCDAGRGKLDCATTGHNLELIKLGNTVLVRREDGSTRAAGIINPCAAEFGRADVGKLTWSDPLSYFDAPAFPNPGTPSGQGSAAYDRRTGYVSTVILGYAAANIGPGTGWRQARGLVLEPDPQLGDYLTAPVEARWDNMLDLFRGLAIPNGLGFRTDTVDRTHYFRVVAARDLTAGVRFARGDANLEGIGWTRTAGFTHVVAAGKGDDQDRLVLLVSTPESEARAEATGPRIYFHSSSTDDSEALRAEALRVLAEKGDTLAVKATIKAALGGRGFRYRDDYGLGDFVTAVAPGLGEITQPVQEVREAIGPSGWSMDVTIGDYAATASTGSAYRARQVLAKVDALDRKH